MSTAEEVAMLEHQIATVLDDMRTEWIEGLLPKLAEFVEGREQAAYRRALEDAADALEETLAGWVCSMGPSEADIGTSQAIDELRGWAAGVGTKDGDDDE